MPAVTVRIEQPANYFRKRGGVWAARYQGNTESFVIGVDKGAEYINILLGRPNQEISVYEIVCGCAIDTCDTLLCSVKNFEDTDEGFQITTGSSVSVMPAMSLTTRPSNNIVKRHRTYSKRSMKPGPLMTL